MVLVVFLWAVPLLALGFRLWFVIEFGLGDRFEAKEDLVPEMPGERCQAWGILGLLLGR